MRIVDAVVDSPSIEYSVSTTQNDTNTLSRVLHIKNISRAKMFDTLEFILDTREGSFSSPDSTSTEPARPIGGDNRFTPWLEGETNQTAVFPVYQLQPGWAIDFSVTQSGASAPSPITVSVFSGPHKRKNEAKSSTGEAKNEAQAEAKTEAVRLVPASLETFVVANEVTLLSILLLAWLFLIVTFVIAKLHQPASGDKSPLSCSHPERLCSSAATYPRWQV